MAASGSGSSHTTSCDPSYLDGPSTSTDPRYATKPVDEQQSESDRQSITDDYLSQIKIECALLEECKQKFDQQIQGIGAMQNGTKSLEVCVNRVNGLFYSMFQEVPVEPAMLTEYMGFQNVYKRFLIKPKNMLDRIIYKKHTNPEVYTTAAIYQYQIRFNFEKARNYFKFGIKKHMNYKPLYIELFWMEIQTLEQNNMLTLSNGMLKFRKCTRHFKNNMEMKFLALDKVLLLNSIRSIQHQIIKELSLKYKYELLMWQKLARINFDGYIYDPSATEIRFDTHCQRRLFYSFKCFEDGMKVMCPEMKNNLWILYVDHVIEVWKSLGYTNKVISLFLRNTMNKVFYHAQDIGVLRNEHYVYWAEYTSYKDGDKDLIEKAIEMNQDNVDIWANILKHYADLKILKKTERVYRHGVRALKDKSLPLWEIMISFLEKNNYRTKIIPFFDQAILVEYENIRTIFQLKYLTWSHNHCSTTYTRKLYKELVKTKPKTKQIHTLMITSEKSKPKPINEIFISKLYNDLCENFGHNDIDIWVDYIKFHETYNNHLEAKQVYKKSLLFLNLELQIILKKEFEKIKAERYTILETIEIN